MAAWMDIPVLWIPYPHAGIQTAGGNSLAVKGDGVDLAEVALQGAQALAGLDVPDFGGRVVASGYYEIAVDLQASYTRLVAHEYACTVA